MKNNWYKKTLLSYIPILYVTIAIIVFISIFVVIEISMKEAEQTKKFTTEHIVSLLETNLATIERRMLEELRIGDALYDFFEFNESNNASRLVNFEASKSLRQLVTEFPIIHSVYLYRIKDQMILTLGSYESITEFPDQQFIFNEIQKSDRLRSWSIPRMFTDGIGIEPSSTNVISFSQRTQLPMGNQGIIVVNVSVDALLSIVDSIVDPEHTYMLIQAKDDSLVYSTNTADDSRKIMTSISSPYIQWQFSSGLQTTFSLNALKMISRSWIAFGIAVILISFMYTVFITKRNYRPIEKIVRQIQSYQQQLSTQKGAASDEFSFIQKAIERLNDENMQYEAQVQQTLLENKNQAFVGLLENYSESNAAKWHITMDRLALPKEIQHAVVAVVEIDHYADFENKYKKGYDQGLIKFALSNVLQEYMNHIGLVWSEWTRLNRMPFIQVLEDPKQYEEWKQSLEKFRVWVAVNMGLTVTIGIGKTVNGWEQLRDSYTEAVEALKYKLSCGSNRTLFYDQVVPLRSNNIHLYYQEINSLVHDYRLGHSQWPQRLADFFARWQREIFNNDENMHVLQYLKSLIVQLQEKLPQELKKLWEETVELQWNELMHKESVQEIAPQLNMLLNGMYIRYTEHMNSKDSKQTIYNIRNYVDQNYRSSDLCLSLISDEFSLNSKYVSQLFKEQLGINFADYVIELRIEHAKRLLLSTDYSINEISNQVGYDIPLSFGRAFKKHVGVSPSDYRKNMVEESSFSELH